ncbi:MAG: anion permease [Chloroflexota bacterium]
MIVSFPFILLCTLTFLFGFFDGFHGSANVVATAVYSRALRMEPLLLLAAISVFIGPFLFGVAVAETLGKELAAPHYFTLPVVMAAVAAAMIWKWVTARLGLPSSGSHALVGGLVGAVWAAHGLGVLQSGGMIKVVAALGVSPLVGLVGGNLMMRLMVFIMRGATPAVNDYFRWGQIGTAVTLGLSHGTNNAQKAMSIIALGLVAEGSSSDFVVPLWVIAGCAGSLALGTLVGGRRIIQTVGGRFYKIRPIHGFSAQTTSTLVMIVVTLWGGPVSTTQVVSSSIIGVGAAERMSKVRWQVFYSIGAAWLLTVPATMLMAAILYFLLNPLIL